MHFPRRAGLLLHITSLPGGHGIGDLGSTAERFVDFLQASGLKIWQILPLGPTASGNSPYSSFSAFAGNPLLISLDRLAAQGLLTTADFADQPAFPTEHVDYGPVGSWKQAKLAIASDRFFARNDAHELDAFQKFAGENAWWLDDYALYMALARHHRTSDWSCWESGLVHRDPASIADWTAKLHDSVRLEKFVQYQFFKQWMELKRYANERGVDILGDLPIFVAYDSSDVWATQSAFCVDGEGRRTVVAGVPPDYFSVTGQLWGNPLYQWDYLASTGYDWWVKRLSHSLAMFDSVRIDHFRGFEAYWEVPGNALTAIDGRWVTGPGAAPFRAAEARGVPLRIVAEDLGMISDAVHALREELAFRACACFSSVMTMRKESTTALRTTRNTRPHIPGLMTTTPSSVGSGPEWNAFNRNIARRRMISSLAG